MGGDSRAGRRTNPVDDFASSLSSSRLSHSSEFVLALGS
jgi:hypothetical protein